MYPGPGGVRLHASGCVHYYQLLEALAVTEIDHLAVVVGIDTHSHLTPKFM